MSPIIRIAEAANRRREAGHKIVSLTTGEPDFPTPSHIVEAAHAAATSGQTRYTPTAGTDALRGAIADRAGAAADQVIVGTGAKQVIFNAMMATVSPGDEVIVTAPFWSSYVDIVRICGGAPIIVDTAPTAFKLTPEALAQAITPRTRWLFINTPSNPSGTVLSPADIIGLADILRSHRHVAILSDQIYHEISYVPFTSFRDAAPDLTARTLTVDGVSKAYSMTGWRIGWGIGNPTLIRAMSVVQAQSTSGASSVSQAAALAALTGPQHMLAERRAVFQARGQRLRRGLEATGMLTFGDADGAFYLFPSCEALLGMTGNGQRIRTDTDFCEYILQAANVATVPGSAFGTPGHLRLSYSYAEDELDRACNLILGACLALT
ncbi:MAG: pyridoxal phosphate-dependent aminotransferase [Tabrizicola sp.]|nr:pyridoxal phosphate-dependent aminotransferase [Tabrizicola sp.]